MPDKNQDAGAEGNHLDEDDLERAGKGVEENASLVANEEDVFVRDSELDNPGPDARKSAKKNDPTEKNDTAH